MKKIIEDFNKTKFAREGGSCFECCDYEAMDKELRDLILKALNQQEGLMTDTILASKQGWIDEGRKQAKEEINRGLYANMGVTKWMEYGKKYKYYDYFKDEIKEEIIKIVEAERSYRDVEPTEYMAVQAIDDILNKIKKL